MLTFPINHWGGPPQMMTVVGGNKFVLASDSVFLSFNKDKRIQVFLEGEFYSDNIGVDAVDIGDISTWRKVEVTIDASCTIFGKGGAGAASTSSSGAGGVGGPGLDVNSANSSAVLTVINNGEIGGGGGGGGAGNRLTINDYNPVGGKLEDCVFNITLQRGSGGGGGGRSTDNSTSGGGARSLSTDGCGTFSHGVAGVLGNEIGAGAGGARGHTQFNTDLGTVCGACISSFGIAGAAGGSWTVAGVNSSSAGGAGGISATNQASADFTNNGTIH